MKLLSFIGQAYQALMIFDLEQAIRLFLSLPPHQQETPWVLGQVAKAYFAAERFKKVRYWVVLTLIGLIMSN